MRKAWFSSWLQPTVITDGIFGLIIAHLCRERAICWACRLRIATNLFARTYPAYSARSSSVSSPSVDFRASSSMRVCSSGSALKPIAESAFPAKQSPASAVRRDRMPRSLRSLPSSRIITGIIALAMISTVGLFDFLLVSTTPHSTESHTRQRVVCSDPLVNVIASSLDNSGVQQEIDLNSTLRFSKFAEPLAEIIGADIVFEMRSLLVERFGANLRKDMAHGLVDHDSFYSPSACYLWWLALHLYSFPVLARLKVEREQRAGTPEVSVNTPEYTAPSSGK